MISLSLKAKIFGPVLEAGFAAQGLGLLATQGLNPGLGLAVPGLGLVPCDFVNFTALRKRKISTVLSFRLDCQESLWNIKE